MHAARCTSDFDPNAALGRAAAAVCAIGWSLSGPRVNIATMSFCDFCVLGDALMDLAEYFDTVDPSNGGGRARALCNLRIDPGEWDAAWAKHAAVLQ